MQIHLVNILLLRENHFLMNPPHALVRCLALYFGHKMCCAMRQAVLLSPHVSAVDSGAWGSSTAPLLYLMSQHLTGAVSSRFALQVECKVPLVSSWLQEVLPELYCT